MNDNKCSFSNEFSENVTLKDGNCPTTCDFVNCNTNPEISDRLSSNCPLLLHNVLPYYYTLKHKGWFPWSSDRKAVVVQCPCENGKVAAEIKSEKGKIRAKITQGTKACPKYKLNDIIDLSDLMKLVCFYKLSNVLPLIGSKTFFENQNSIGLDCGYGEQPAHFQLNIHEENSWS